LKESSVDPAAARLSLSGPAWTAMSLPRFGAKTASIWKILAMPGMLNWTYSELLCLHLVAALAWMN
jgi:hypothetical protein